MGDSGDVGKAGTLGDGILGRGLDLVEENELGKANSRRTAALLIGQQPV